MTTPAPPEIPSVPDHELLRLIGRGSYGEVWLARNIMGVWRAVKVVTRASFDSDRPFEREFAGIQRFEPISRTGDGLVPILHVGSHRGKEAFYYVMELADGQAGGVDFDPATYAPRTLGSDLKRQGRLPVEECVEIGLNLATGLSLMHKHGLVHRDIKPSNIVFARGRAKLADVGLVGRILEARTFVGTEGYIPPEGPGTPGADLFALGKVLHEAATGLSPEEFPNPPADWLTGEIPHGALDLHEVILRACESDPARRYRNAAQMQADLALMQSGQSVRRARRLEKRVRTLRRVGWAAGLAALLATGLGLLAAYRAGMEADNVRSANELRGRAEVAERGARAQLAEAQLARASMERRAGMAGQRGRALELLREAAAFHTNRVELRSETAAALALADLREVERGSDAPADATGAGDAFRPERARDLVSGPRGWWCALDQTLTRYTKAHADGSVRVHAWDDDRELATLEGIQAMDATVGPFSERGDRLAGAAGLEVFVWETATGRRIFGHASGTATGIDLTPDGKFAALRANGSGTIQLFHLPDGAPGPEIDVGLSGGDYWFSPNSRELAAYEPGQNDIRRIDLASGREIGRWRLPAGVGVARAFWAPDSGGLLATGDDFCAYYARFDAPRLTAARLQGHTAEVMEAAFHPTRPYALTSSWDGSSRLWDLRNGRPLAVLPRPGFQPRWTARNRIGWTQYDGAGRYRLGELRMFEPEGVRLLTEPTPEEAASSQKGPWQGTFVADGAAFAAATHDGVRVWASDGEGESVLAGLGPTRWAHLADDGSRLWSSSARGLHDLRLDWNAPRRALSIQIPEPRKEFAGGEWALGTRAGKAGVVAAYGFHYVEADQGGFRQLGAFERFTKFMAASPDGRWTLSGAHSDTDLTLWRTEPWAKVRQVPSGLSPQAVFTPDSQSFIITSRAEVRRERVEDGEVEWSFRPAGPHAPGTSVALSQDAGMVAVTIGATEAALLDARTGELLLQLRPLETGLISDLAFSRDGQRLAVLTQNHFGHLWDLSLLRARLRALGLDWDPPAPAAAPGRPPPISIRVVEMERKNP